MPSIRPCLRDLVSELARLFRISYRFRKREKRRQRNSDRLCTPTGVAIGRWTARNRKLRAWASGGRYCGEIWPTGYALPAMRFPFHCNSAGVAARRVGITGLSTPAGAAALINAVIVVKMTLAVVAAWIAIFIMLIIVVSVCAGACPLTVDPGHPLTGLPVRRMRRTHFRRRCLLTVAPQWTDVKRALSAG